VGLCSGQEGSEQGCGVHW